MKSEAESGVSELLVPAEAIEAAAKVLVERKFGPGEPVVASDREGAEAAIRAFLSKTQFEVERQPARWKTNNPDKGKLLGYKQRLVSAWQPVESQEDSRVP